MENLKIIQMIDSCPVVPNDSDDFSTVDRGDPNLVDYGVPNHVQIILNSSKAQCYSI